jgi:hypothetical protein
MGQAACSACTARWKLHCLREHTLRLFEVHTLLHTVATHDKICSNLKERWSEAWEARLRTYLHQAGATASAGFVQRLAAPHAQHAGIKQTWARSFQSLPEHTKGAVQAIAVAWQTKVAF